MYKANVDFLWFKKGEEVKKEDVKEHPNWIKEGLVVKVSEKEIKESEKAALKAEKDAKELKAKEFKESESKKVEESKKAEGGNSYLNELVAINGIGKSTAEDIIKVFPTKDSLKKGIAKEQDLPFREDVVKLLIKTFK